VTWPCHSQLIQRCILTPPWPCHSQHILTPHWASNSDISSSRLIHIPLTLPCSSVVHFPFPLVPAMVTLTQPDIATQHFKTTQLPSGQYVNVALSIGTDGHGGIPIGSGNPRDFDPDFKIDSEFRQSFKKPAQQDWHRGNTSRYARHPLPHTHTAPLQSCVPAINPSVPGARAPWHVIPAV